MKTRLPTLFALLLISLASACGSDEEGIVLEIKADGLTVPDDVNAVEVLVLAEYYDADAQVDKTREIANKLYPLDGTEQFPLTVALIPSAGTPEQVIVEVSALLDSNPVAAGQKAVAWRSEMIVEASVDLYPIGTPVSQ